MRIRRTLAPALAGCLAIAAAANALGGGTDSDETPPVFTEAYLNDPANIEVGRGVWQQQCRHCHGHAAYPGKAPKLKPRRYTADFVYKRVTNGFRKMPSWKEVFTREERMGVVAWVLSKDFSP